MLGSPLAMPDSDSGYKLWPEPNPEGPSVITGTVSMYPVFNQMTGEMLASGSQFFIAYVAEPEAESDLSSFGLVIEGFDVLLQLETGAMVESITISEK